MSSTFEAALYARVSTEDRQSPADSIAWQRSIAAALIETVAVCSALPPVPVQVNR